MTWSKPLDDIELAYIEKAWPQRSCTEIAEKLGRSKRAVENAVNRLGLREPRARAREAHAPRGAPDACGEEDQDELDELRELKRTLKHSMNDAGPAAMPRLSAEYREVLARISELEGGAGASGGKAGGGLAGIIGFVPVQPA